MTHPLDRPVWNALASRQAALSLGDARARRFAQEFGLFAACADPSPASLEALAALVKAHGPVAMVEADPDHPLPPETQALSRAPVAQMVAETLTPGEAAFEVVDLGEADAPQMLALATLTEPGPFFARTHELGGFVGVKQDGRLIAMAGERMRPDGFTEVSGVCTHPDHRGRGYAGGLMRRVASRIAARGDTPFLHAYAHNTGAIALYESLGFRWRTDVVMTMLAPT